MQIYAPFEYPGPEFYSAIERTPATDIFITMRFHTNADGSDFIIHANPDIKGILAETPHGNLLVDLWADEDGQDWIASSVFKVTTDTLELAEARVFGRWRNLGLVNLMIARAQDTTGWSRELLDFVQPTG